MLVVDCFGLVVFAVDCVVCRILGLSFSCVLAS